MDYKIYFGLAAAIIAVVCYGIYFYQIFSGRVKPHPFSWFVWGSTQTIAFLGQWVKGAGPGSWSTGLTAVACLVIAVLALWKNQDSDFYKHKIDWVFFTSAVIAVILWMFTNDPTLSIILLTITDALAMVITARKSYFAPYQESLSLFGLSAVRSLLAVIGIQTYNVATWLFPGSLIVTNSVLVLIIFIRRRQVKI